MSHTVRHLAKQPIFSLVAIASLALGIGINTAIFSALDALLLRPLPLRNLDRTVIVYDTNPGNSDAGTTFPAFQALAARNDVFARVMATAGSRQLSMTDGDTREAVFAEIVTSDFFRVADVSLHLGRPLSPDADRVTAPAPEAVVSHAFWQRRFNGDPDVVGKTLTLNGQAFLVMGVAREGFTGLDAEASVDMWVPLTVWAHLISEPGRLTGQEHWIRTFAELPQGVSIDQARSVVASMPSDPARKADEQTRVRPARDRFSVPVIDMLAITGGAFSGGLLILALACANVMSLLLARAAARQREMSVRMALGSSRARLVRLWIGECLVLSTVAGACGLLLASWLLDLVVAFKPPVEIGQSESATLPLTFQLDLRVFVFALTLSTLVAVVIGALSGLQGSRTGSPIGIPSATATGRRFAPGFNLRSGVIALQIALSLLLLIPCGLFIRSSLNASSMPTGFADRNVILLPVSSNQAGVRVKKPGNFELQLTERVSQLAGVDGATVMDPVPLWFGGKFAHFAAEGGDQLRMGYACITPGYFKTMQIALVHGRDFTRGDTSQAPHVAIVNETLARRWWPGENAVGKRIKTFDGLVEVVGVARDAKYLSLAETGEPWLYLPLMQSESDNAALSLAVRTTADPAQMRAVIEREVKALMPSWPQFQFRSLDEGVALQRSLPRFGAMVLGVLGGLGALLAAVGIYGVMAYVVEQRTREIGIRLALGAPSLSVVQLMIRQGMAVSIAGGAVGLLVALGVAQFLRSVLFGVSAADPIAYVSVSSLLLGVAWIACYLPARRAAAVNPVEILRKE